MYVLSKTSLITYFKDKNSDRLKLGSINRYCSENWGVLFFRF